MTQEYQEVQWVCMRCGGSGSARLPVDLCDFGVVNELVRAHSLACGGGCDANARTTLRTRPRDFSDEAWEQVKQRAKQKAAQADPGEGGAVPIVASEPRFSIGSLRRYLDGGPRLF